MRSSRGNCRQRQNTAITRQPPLLRSGGSLDPRETSRGDCGQTRQMPRKLKETSWRVSFCQDPQYCGIFLQAAVSDSVYLPECGLLDLLWRNSGLRVAGPAAECVSGLAGTLITMQLWICFTERAQRGVVIILVVRERFLVRYVQWYFNKLAISVPKVIRKLACGTNEFVVSISPRWQMKCKVFTLKALSVNLLIVKQSLMRI